ncbi:MAG: hypothetical protein CL905_00930 [Dehalococcoidia bacterium]|nr:hypothetical protein [Dehalococcoidia bacterium]|tara:strand:- start:345 stop:1220 length:876 start_codon:yes stop_codon:yes gene_type:complete
MIGLGESLALLSALFHASGGIFIKSIKSKISAFQITAFRFWIATPCLLLLTFFSVEISELPNIPLIPLLLIVLATIINTAGILLFTTAIMKGRVGITYTTSTSMMIFFSLLWGILLKIDTISLWAIIGSIFILTGVYLVNRTNNSNEPKIDKKIMFLPIMAALLWSVGLILTDFSLKEIEPMITATIRALIPAVGFTIWILITKKEISISNLTFKDKSFMGASSLLGLGSSLSFIFALSLTRPSITVILNSVSPIFAVLLSFIFLKEKLSLHQIIGVLISISGTMVIVIMI